MTKHFPFTTLYLLLLFAAVFYAAAEPVTDEARQLSARIGRRSAALHFFLPGFGLRLFLLFLAAALSALLAGRASLLPALLVFVLALAAFGFGLKLLPGKAWQGMLCLFLLILALAACPIYSDLSLQFPPAARLRLFLPPYWLWMLAP